MKKLFVYGLSIALMAGAASCKKSSKGKLSNDWNLKSMSQTSSDTDGSGNTTTSTMEIADGAVTITDTDANNVKTTQTGTVTTATWTIAKDGTWTRTIELNITSLEQGGTTTAVDGTMSTMESGTWDFMGGVSKDWKKNERVVFNTLSSTQTSKYVVGGTTYYDNTTTDTYAEGENSEVMVITDSKKKELGMSRDEDNSSKDTDNTSSTSTTTSGTSTMTVELTQE